MVNKMTKIKFITLALSICLLTACIMPAQAVQTAVAQTQAVRIPPPISDSIPEPTAAFLPPSVVAAILGDNGFVLDPSLEGNCASICTSYQRTGPWMVANVFDNGGLEILSGKSDIQVLVTVIKQLYGEDITEWVADHIGLVINKNESQSGSASNYDIRMGENDNVNIVWIMITPKE
jgi:hypothetical protein